MPGESVETRLARLEERGDGTKEVVHGIRKDVQEFKTSVAQDFKDLGDKMERIFQALGKDRDKVASEISEVRSKVSGVQAKVLMLTLAVSIGIPALMKLMGY